MSQATRQFSSIEYVGGANPQLAAITTRIPPGLNRRRVYPYLFVTWAEGQQFNRLVARILFLRGGVECGVLPLAAMQSTLTGDTAACGSLCSLASGGNAERDSIALYPATGVLAVPSESGPVAGENTPVIIQPFYMNVDADEFQLDIDVATQVTNYHIWVGVFSDLLDNSGL